MEMVMSNLVFGRTPSEALYTKKKRKEKSGALTTFIPHHQTNPTF